MRTLGGLALAALALAPAACGPSRGRMLEGEITQAAQTGGRVELERLYRAPWEKVCVLVPYVPPRQADSLLGFHVDVHDVSASDALTAIVFVRGGQAAAVARIPRATADFAPPRLTAGSYCLARQRAVFRSMHRAGAGPALVPDTGAAPR